MEILIYGIINSMLLVLMTVGFALAYSVSRVPNFMHGALLSSPDISRGSSSTVSG